LGSITQSRGCGYADLQAKYANDTDTEFNAIIGRNSSGRLDQW